MISEVGQSGNDLHESITDAVTAGRLEVDRLGELAGSVMGSYCVLSLTATSLEPAIGDFAGEVERRHRNFCEKMREHLDRQRDVLSTFNIVFFGRTGVGKSTLLSAFGELDGSAVSPGESDWTVESNSILWKGCRLFDTPGINGWGRTKRREDLESTARKAVEVADVVVLCFDNQSQQAAEFAKVGEWVRHFGKPTIAVLNNRNLRWRHPARVPDPMARRNMSESVRQHVANIRGELANIGLFDTPVVAIHSRRALFARASTPYRGPSEVDFHHERETYGLKYLYSWSNFAVLEALISAGVRGGGSELRLTSLREGMRTILRDEAIELSGLVDEMAGRIAELDRAVERYLETLGYLESDERTTHFHDTDFSENLLSLVEEVRGAPYRAPADGSFSRQLRNLVKPHLAEPRSKAMQRFRALEQDAFEKKEKVDAQRFSDVVFDEREIEVALAEVWSRGSAFLDRELSIAAAELKHNGHGSTVDSASFDGRAGQSAELLETLLKGSSLLGGVGLIFAMVSNPVGWAMGVMLAGAGLVNWGVNLLGQSSGKTAAKQRASARAQAHRAGTEAVFKAFRLIEENFIRDSKTLAWRAASPGIAGLLNEVLHVSSLRDRVAQLSRSLMDTSDSITTTSMVNPFADSLQTVACDNRSSLNEASIEHVMLGEDWLESGTPEIVLTQDVDQYLADIYRTRSQTDLTALQAVINNAFANADVDRIAAWNARVQAAAMDDGMWNETQLDSSQKVRPKIVVLGDFSSGKSSFIKRLLVETTGTSPESLEIRAEPTTDVARTYPLRELDLVDTPGFQSGRPGHDDRALSAADGAALAIMLFQVNLLIGDTTALESIVKGSPVFVGIGPRILFLINRCDEIGVDPEGSPNEYLGRVDRKKAELRAALSMRDIDVDLSRIHGIASDPFGIVGQQWPVDASAYKATKVWDGLAPLIGSLNLLSAQVLQNAQWVAEFDGQCSRLMRSRLRIQAELEIAQAEAEKFGSVTRALVICLEDGEFISRSIERGITERVDRRAARAVEEIRLVEQGDLSTMKDLTTSWANDDALSLDLEQFMESACEEINEWARIHESAIGREFAAAKFSGSLGLPGFESAAGIDAEEATRNVGEAAKAAQKLAAGLGNRDAVYGIGKAVGYKFKPWGAVKAGRAMARVAVVLQVAAVAIEAAGWYRQTQSQKEWKKLADNAEADVDTHAQRVVDGLLSADDSPSVFVDARRQLVRNLLDETLARHATVQSVIERYQDQLADVQQLLSDAETIRKGMGSGGWKN